MANKKATVVEEAAVVTSPVTCTACNGAALINGGKDYCPRCEGTAIEPVVVEAAPEVKAEEPANG